MIKEMVIESESLTAFLGSISGSFILPNKIHHSKHSTVCASNSMPHGTSQAPSFPGLSARSPRRMLTTSRGLSRSTCCTIYQTGRSQLDQGTVETMCYAELIHTKADLSPAGSSLAASFTSLKGFAVTQAICAEFPGQNHFRLKGSTDSGVFDFFYEVSPFVLKRRENDLLP